MNEPELWKKTEDMTREVLKGSGINYVEVPKRLHAATSGVLRAED